MTLMGPTAGDLEKALVCNRQAGRQSMGEGLARELELFAETVGLRLPLPNKLRR